MKLKFVSLILAVIILTTALFSCGTPFSSHDDTSPELSLGESTENAKETDTETVSDPFHELLQTEIVYPEISVSTMKYTLSDTDVESFIEKLNTCKALFFSNSKKNEDKLEKELYALGTMSAYIETQNRIALVLYEYALSDKTAQENQKESSKIYADINDKLWDFLAEAKRENNNLTPIITKFMDDNYSTIDVYDEVESDRAFAQMTQIKNRLLQYNRQATYEEAYDLYTKYIYEAQKYAKAHNYDNFYDFSSDIYYHRDYGKEERDLMRRYVKEYLVPLYRIYDAKSDALDAQLTTREYAMSERYLHSSYDTYWGDPLLSYIESLPSNAGQTMLGAFEKDRVMIGDRKDSYNNAGLRKVGNIYICYLHEDKSDLVSASHLLGYYYFHTLNGNRDKVSQDLQETHAQANSFLMMNFLSREFDNAAFEAAAAYTFSNMLYQAISSAIRDEFEEIVFYDPLSYQYSIDELNSIMEKLIEEYGVADLSKNIVTQLMTYWNRLGTENVGTHISYTTAFIVSLQIYLDSVYDYQAATLCYQSIVENIDGESTFLKTISDAGLLSPFDEELYIKFTEMVSP